MPRQITKKRAYSPPAEPVVLRYVGYQNKASLFKAMSLSLRSLRASPQTGVTISFGFGNSPLSANLDVLLTYRGKMIKLLYLSK